MKQKLKDAVHGKINFKTIGILFVWAFVVNLIIETLQRVRANGVWTGGFTGGLKAIIEQPFIFLWGVLAIMAMLSISLLFKRRYCAMIVISFIWIAFGVVDFVLLSYRVTPFTAVEFKLINAALGVINKYVSPPLMVLLILVIAGVVALFVYCWRKAPRVEHPNRIRSMFAIVAMTAVLCLTTMFGVGTGRLATYFPNLADAFLDYGFVYCFASSFNTGIHKPSNYSEEKVAEIISGSTSPDDSETTDGDGSDDTEDGTASETDENDSSAAETAATEDTDAAETVANATVEPNTTDPNVIFLQLESFFDITAVTDLELSEDPVPFFRYLKENYSSGYLSVPVIGAGTANTEFEIMTGMNLDFFGAGEYPYKTVLETQTCESLAYIFKENGYTSHAIHNNRANFYSRNKIFSQLGYDTFTSIELMDISEYTETGWAKDKYLTEEILKVLDSTENRDYVYTISVQGHGKYPKEQLIEDPAIQVLGGVSEDRWYGVEYYVNQIYEMDQFLEELVEALEERDEPTILVVYGDHLPGLSFSAEDLVNGDMNQTEYVIWSNFDMEKEDEDIEAYQLGSRVLERIGISTGIINAYHQTHKDTDEEEYQEDLQILCYDMLYGNTELTSEMYVATDLQYGVTNVEITGIEQDEDDLNYIIITGNYFTQYSRVMCGNEKLETEFVDEHTLRAQLPDYTEGDTLSIVVEQNYKGKLLLQTSNEMTFTPEASEYLEEGEDYQNNNDNFVE